MSVDAAKFEPALAELTPGHQLTIRGPAGDITHRFLIMVTDREGFHTGRRTFLVVCATCRLLIHEATTGPLENVDFHLRESKIFPRPA